jgi:hypothetical protein
MSPKKAILLLYPISHSKIAKRLDDLNKCCAESNLDIFHSIYADDEYDYKALNELMDVMEGEGQKERIAVIVDAQILKYSVYMLAWCVLATLAKTKLMDVYLYEAEIENTEFIFGNARFEGLERNKEDLLEKAAVYLNHLITIFSKNM